MNYTISKNNISKLKQYCDEKNSNIIPNYNKLCKILEINNTGGLYKKQRLEELSIYIEFEKKGHKFIIVDFKTDTAVKQNIFKLNSYKDNLRYLLYDSLLKHGSRITENNSNNYCLIISKTKILTMLNIAKDDYIKCLQFDKNNGIGKSVLNDFYRSTRGKFDSTIKSILKEMNDRKNAYVDMDITFCRSKNNGNLHIADNLDIDIIMNIENTIAKDMGFKGRDRVFISGRYEEFLSKVHDNIISDDSIWFDYYYKGYRIIYDRWLIKSFVDGLDLSNLQEIINKQTVKYLNDKFARLQKKEYSKDFDEFGILDTNYGFRKDKNYIPSIEYLINNFIKI